MPQDEDRVFDISKPHKTAPDATSRPVIVGHQPQMTDPMVNEHRPAEPQQDPAGPEHHASDSSLESSPANDAKPAHVTIPVHEGEPQQAPLMEHHMEIKEPEFVPTTEPTAEPTPESVPESTPMSIPEPETKAPEAPTNGPNSIYSQHNPNQPEQMPPANPNVITPVATETVAAATVAPGPPMDDLPLPSHHAAHTNHTHVQHPAKHGKDNGKLLWIIAILILLLGVYALVDATTSVLPFHIFKKPSAAVTQTTAAVNNNTPAAAPTPSIPAGFKNYTVSSSGASFNYPAAWGDPTIVADPGFTQRGGSNTSDGTYAYLVNFATNKDVQVALTSSKFLPIVRPALYYDFLQVCIGTNDGKYYKSSLHFTSANGVDTPSTATCDQGPLNDATKVDPATIVQLNTKAPDGSALGDLYTKNLASTALAVVRVKDGAKTNSANIKTLLDSVRVVTVSGTGTGQ